jgi:hypothetical protein
MYDNKKPEPLNTRPTPNICPVCGYSSYSSSGIHPQCAVSQADEPRRLRLAAERKARAELVKKHAEGTEITAPGAQLP